MKTLVYIILTALVVNFSFSQNEKKNNDLFNLDVLNFYSPEGTKSRVDLYVEVPLGNLEFKRSKTDKSMYISKFDLNIDVKDKDGKLVYNNLSKEEVTTQETGQQYLSHNSQILTRNLFLAPGEYDIKVSIDEKSTQKFAETKRTIKVEDFASQPLSISDVMVVSQMSESAGKKTITPDVARNVGTIDTFYLFYYVYKNNEDAFIDVNCRIFDNSKKEVFSRKEIIDASQESSFQNQFFMSFPTYGMAYGKYTIEITAESKSSNASESTFFENQSFEFPLPLTEIDELISQLQYIAKDEEMDYMKAGKTAGERQKRFIEFWKKKDPSPSTRRNEIMQEYYRRLMLADKKFSTMYTKGWKTDMGMVYVIFGEPNNIDRHPFELDTKPYEVWQYYELNRDFVFVDNSGFGDYRLITPIWDTFRFAK
ncbi:MAG TPA: GWxTD domain-containing protein [Ignavibacteria bacterium]|jgi:GWxTD domain-containing protein